ncbi:hypothetical protein J7376_10640 [Paracoccus sp. R12_1]|jgi:hypothetical protein|uniref:hypothetical protein n=1 Tax=unclassified Paracoccus (in: a-proteobacteria) TaxID=2688777 RepID=UPI001ADCF814|nr:MULTISPECIES: hypothetical protein [unclassified Paracoccus (in: a-proteobacteria)]MBO9453600.1 hypothetical protein [Paracoccus sp. R12_2]MBO9486976.1 hypothetical protein [Paracoccus sp. R12_1]
MTKHISDQPRAHAGTRLREYTRQEREAGMHPAVATLRARPQTRGQENRKTAEYLRIERDRLA